jgi:hypothetical protein
MTQPENLNIWDRIFNRTRREIIERGQEQWHKTYGEGSCYQGQKVPNSQFTRDFVVYRIIDRVTGSEKIEKKYLN